MMISSDMALVCAKYEGEKERKERELKEREVHALERIATALGELLSRFSEKQGEQGV